MFRLLFGLALFAAGCSRNAEPVSHSGPQDAEGEVNTPACILPMPSLEGNSFLDADHDQYAILLQADSSWQLDIYQRSNCLLEHSALLPIPESPDYPYYLADLLYNSSNRLLGLRGPKQLLVYDLETRHLSEAQQPQFLNERLSSADAGLIEHLEVWEDYLVGCSSEWGSFAFRIEGNQLKPVLPVAELEKDGLFHSLFLIESGETDLYQAILPAYDYDDGVFRINPLFAAPIALEPEQTIYAAGSPYARLRKAGDDLVAVDLVKRQLINGIQSIKLEEE